MSERNGPDEASPLEMSPSAPGAQGQPLKDQFDGAPYDQKEEAAKAIRFMVIKAAVFILIPVVASALAIFILL
ncbi:hypothetical protein SAMN04488056_110180 [Cohaesibacter marisflavi]|uniref:Uncharacterized protein n=1 Tax=Cohaesibacter marisflavi TaxID=655353 RepID=A0A1I5J2Z9_9HYPH|nr:phosphoribosylformylglycinamidine synthase-associated small membrane protein [Cohaesibacter marisflavi]SFO67178.1 hypothetical protein SAMN04488056_110180 [Cohaesibacter marisflavi]